jgi:LasA protease
MKGFNSGLVGKSCVLACLMALGAYITPIHAEEADEQPQSTHSQGISKQEFIYSYDEMLNFDIEEYLQAHAPHLVPYAEEISHYAGYSSVSPKVLIALMEHQTGVVTQSSTASKLDRPFGDLSKKVGFREQLEDISSRLAKEFYRDHSFDLTGRNDKLTSDKDAQNAIMLILSKESDGAMGILRKRGGKGDTTSSKEVGKAYRKLFEGKKKEEESKAQLVTISDINDYFQLPFPAGESWRNGGSHTNHGSGRYPQSSLDFNAGGYWGDNLSHIWVSSAAPGTIKNHSSCFTEIIHEDGWSTTYYHIENIQYVTGSRVGRDVRVANYANDKPQALCNGGQSTGPHLHFSMKKNGQLYHLNGMKFSGYEVRTGRDSYDSNCSYFWLARAGYKYCAWTNVYNYGVTDSEPPEQGDTYTGYLNHQGSQIQPDGSWFYYSGGTIAGDLTGPSSADFDLKLERWNGYNWYQVAISETPASQETISYTANSGYYRMVVYSYSGSGNYSLRLVK